jgi:hypothetical protein
MSEDDRIVDLLERAAPAVQVAPEWRSTQRRIRRDRRRRNAVAAGWIALVVVVLVAGVTMVMAGQRRGLGVETGVPDATVPPPSGIVGGSIVPGTTTTTLVPQPSDANLPDVADVRCTDTGGSVTPRVRSQADGVHFHFDSQPNALYSLGNGAGFLGPVKAGVDGIVQAQANVTYPVSCQLNVNDPASKHAIGSLTVVDANASTTPAVDPSCKPTYALTSRSAAPADITTELASQLQAVIGQPVDVSLTGYQSSSSPTYNARLGDRVVASGQVAVVFGFFDVDAHVCADAPHVPAPTSPAGRAIPTADAAITAVRAMWDPSLAGRQPGIPAPPPLTDLQAKFATPAEVVQASNGAVASVPYPRSVDEWFVLARSTGPKPWTVYAVDADSSQDAVEGPQLSTGYNPPTPVAMLTDEPSWWASVPDRS